jgi:hypothetical protein
MSAMCPMRGRPARLAAVQPVLRTLLSKAQTLERTRRNPVLVRGEN